MVDAIVFEIGGFPSTEFQLASSEGLAPLSLPLPLPLPSQDSVRRFQNALEEDVDCSLAEPKSKNVALAEKPITSERVGISAGLTELRIINPSSVQDIAPVVQEIAPVVVETPVVRPDIPVSISSSSSVKESIPVITENTPVIKESVTVVKENVLVVRENTPVAKESITVVKENAPVAKESAPVVVETPVVRSDIPVSISSSSSVKESVTVVKENVPVVRENTPVAKESITVVKENAPVAKEIAPVIVETPVERPDVPVSITSPAKKTVELSRSQDVRVEVAPEKLVQEKPVQEKPVLEKPVLDKPVLEKLAPEKPTLENPAFKEHVIEKLEPKKAVPEEIATEKLKTDKPQVLVATPMSAPPVDITATPQSVEVQQVASIDSARTEAVVSKVAKAIEVVNQIVETVVSEISVTPALARGEGEILITLKPTVLDGSELKLTAKSGELTVSISPATVGSMQIVQQNLPRLETALAEHAPSFHHVAVVIANVKKGKEK